jgi:8-oxo-dGTP pyrophosphatase MutT (NUDIX family)
MMPPTDAKGRPADGKRLSDRAWLTALHRRADQPPERPREPLCIEAVEVGSIEPALGRRLQAAGLPVRGTPAGWQIEGRADEALALIAGWLDAHGLCSRWRGELLAVDDAGGTRRAVVERAAVRPLGIATHAVHLIGRTTDGRWWVQQRALDKATDPGLWDTLMGGLVGAGESIAQTLGRETAEEAGLDVAALEQLVPAGRVTVRRPVSDGYMIERIDVFEAVVPDRLEPVNRDGEVARFECLHTQALHARLLAGVFTLEAALILAASLQREPSA